MSKNKLHYSWIMFVFLIFSAFSKLFSSKKISIASLLFPISSSSNALRIKIKAFESKSSFKEKYILDSDDVFLRLSKQNCEAKNKYHSSYEKVISIFCAAGLSGKNPFKNCSSSHLAKVSEEK